jgi:hypothetical protein
MTQKEDVARMEGKPGRKIPIGRPRSTCNDVIDEDLKWAVKIWNSFTVLL